MRALDDLLTYSRHVFQVRALLNEHIRRLTAFEQRMYQVHIFARFCLRKVCA